MEIRLALKLTQQSSGLGANPRYDLIDIYQTGQYDPSGQVIFGRPFDDTDIYAFDRYEPGGVVDFLKGFD